MEDAIATLPAGLKSKITPELDFMAMISMLEGTFGSVSESFWTPYCKHESHGKAGWKGTRTRSKADADKAVAEHEKANKDHDADVKFEGDSAASLGIHQWAMDKDTAGGGGSLVEFFKELKSRSTKAEAKKAPDRTEEEAIYVEAWGQCTAAGLKIVDGKLQINGKDATGLEVEDALAGPMATGGLRKYQVIQIAEELEELWAKPLAPGMFGSQMIGNKYAASSDFGTKDATFPTDKYTIKLSAPAKVATIGEACTDERLKLAVANIFPNRPNWMGAIVWRSLISGDPQALVANLIAKIVKAEEAKPPPAEAKKEPEAKADPKKKKPAKKAKAPAKPEITEDMAADKQAFKDLQALVWPSAPTPTRTSCWPRSTRPSCRSTRARREDAARGRTGGRTRRRRRRPAARSATAGSRAPSAWPAPTRGTRPRAGDADRAAAELDRAATQFELRGAFGQRDAAERELRRLGRRGPATGARARSPTDRRSSRSRSASCRSRGWSSIAGRTRRSRPSCTWSTKTVDPHLRNLSHKLGVSSRVEVARVIERADANAAAGVSSAAPGRVRSGAG